MNSEADRAKLELLDDETALIAMVRTAHQEQLALCTLLETIADSLPASVDTQACLYAARSVGRVIARAHKIEEEFLFPLLQKRWSMLPDLEETIDRLKYEHMEDTCYADEIYDALIAYGRGEPRLAPDAYGYMLRGFFEGLRRHIAFESEIILPLLELPSRSKSEVQN